MRPLSALKYIKENKIRSLIIILMLYFTMLLYMAGNYIDSVYYYWDRDIEYTEKMLVVSALSTDEDYTEFEQLYEKLLNDPLLTVMPRTPYGSQGLPWICTMGFEMGSASMVFDTPEDLKKAFEYFGINADLSDVSDDTVCISTALAAQYGLKKGDVIDSSVVEGFTGKYTIAALLDDDSFIVFYVMHSDYEGVPVRLNVFGNGISGNALYDHIMELKGGLKADVTRPAGENIAKNFEPFILIFGVGIVFLTIILSVIVNSVISGQFISRRYEFGVFRAIGISKKAVYGKVAGELIMMDIIATVSGSVFIFLLTFLLNELLYIPKGQYLPYYSDMGMYAFLLSNFLVVIPTIFLKGKSMASIDVTEF